MRQIEGNQADLFIGKARALSLKMPISFQLLRLYKSASKAANVTFGGLRGVKSQPEVDRWPAFPSSSSSLTHSTTNERSNVSCQRELLTKSSRDLRGTMGAVRVSKKSTLVVPDEKGRFIWVPVTIFRHSFVKPITLLLLIASKLPKIQSHIKAIQSSNTRSQLGDNITIRAR